MVFIVHFHLYLNWCQFFLKKKKLPTFSKTVRQASLRTIVISVKTVTQRRDFSFSLEHKSKWDSITMEQVPGTCVGWVQNHKEETSSRADSWQSTCYSPKAHVLKAWSSATGMNGR
jgi:hypothetical protein